MLSNSYWPLWLAVLLSVLAGAYQLVTEFQRLANLLGPIGRRIYRKSRERFKMDTEEFNEAVMRATAQERERWEQDEARDLLQYRERLKYIGDLTEEQQRELREIQWQLRCHNAHSEYDSEWHRILRRLISRANQNGGAIPVDELPEHVHYSEFENMCRDNKSFDWRKWGII